MFINIPYSLRDQDTSQDYLIEMNCTLKYSTLSYVSINLNKWPTL